MCGAQVPQALTVNKNQSSQNFSTKTTSKVFSVKYEHKYFVSYYLMNNEKQKYSRGLKTSILGPKLGSFLVQFFFDFFACFLREEFFVIKFRRTSSSNEEMQPLIRTRTWNNCTISKTRQKENTHQRLKGEN